VVSSAYLHARHSYPPPWTDDDTIDMCYQYSPILYLEQVLVAGHNSWWWMGGDTNDSLERLKLSVKHLAIAG
jgi:hypothetical protein